ncbi:hypothetical protein Micbo1qcDRAFT_233357 [Microdochium bolleyi]|uniref:Cytochrome c oxidase assembly factor 3 n=1 Tax=Microdochium bolleyi TaxID=196109 RepID=A0A136J493_9PEZI|nr:hypothetical protein Micbo1qcDRAFT_233357 [Microdochium bolleyi]
MVLVAGFVVISSLAMVAGAKARSQNLEIQGGFGRQSSYYDSKLRQSPALIRARRPYLFKNVMVGVATAGLAASVYIYTLNAVGQDEFDDVKVPGTTTTTTTTQTKK